MHPVIFALSLCVILLIPKLVIGAAAPVSDEVVDVYNWPDYMPEGVLEDFTRETGIKVNYSIFNNNEIMYTKLKLLKGRGYDVLVPSTYMIERLQKDRLLQPIDKTLISNFSQLDPALLNKPFDPGNEWSIPYMWGSIGIAVNVSDPDAAAVTSWEDLWHTRWRDKLLLLDDMRGIFHMALKLNGDSTNATAPDEIKKAYERLSKLMPNVKLLKADAPRESLLSGDVNLGVVWNGEAVLAQAENPKIHYIYPKEGASFWIDSFVIPARAAHPENAHKFIDYMMRPEVAVRCVTELGYATPNLVAKASLDKSIQDNTAIFPPAGILEKAEFQQDVGDALDLYTLYWDKLKIEE